MTENKDTNQEYSHEKLSAIDQDLQAIETKETIDKSFTELMDDKNLLKSTDLTITEIAKLNILYTYGTKFGFTNLVTLVENFMRMKVSKSRKGREEVVSVASASMLHDERLIKLQHSQDSRLRKG